MSVILWILGCMAVWLAVAIPSAFWIAATIRAAERDHEAHVARMARQHDEHMARTAREWLA